MILLYYCMHDTFTNSHDSIKKKQIHKDNLLLYPHNDMNSYDCSIEGSNTITSNLNHSLKKALCRGHTFA